MLERGPTASAPRNDQPRAVLTNGPQRADSPGGSQAVHQVLAGDCGADAEMRIVVAEARVPFVRDGAELHAQSLVTQLRLRGHDAETVALPFIGRKDMLLDEACAWRMLNLSASNARDIDVLIA